MNPGEEVQIVKGKFQGRRAKVRGTDGWFYQVQVLTPSGDKDPNGLVSIHRTAIAVNKSNG